MNTKKTTTILTGVILFLTTLLGLLIYDKFAHQSPTENQTESSILELQKKFKKDSIAIVNSYTTIINKTKQDLIDSLTATFNENIIKVKLKRKIFSKKTVTTTPKSKNKYTSNVTLYSKGSDSYYQNNPKKVTPNSNISNVTSYTKLPGYVDSNTHQYQPRKKSKYTSNVTLYTKKPGTYQQKNSKNTRAISKSSNVTSYTKLPEYVEPNHQNPKNSTKYTSNVISHRALNTQNTATTIKAKRPKQSITFTKNKQPYSSHLRHNEPELNQSVNFNSIDTPPIFPGCESFTKNEDLKNCFEIKVRQHIIRNFNINSLNKTGLKKNVINKLRILFIIDESGRTNTGKIVGNWNSSIKREAIRAIESVPHMKPGLLNGRYTKVKYSMPIPFIVN